VLRVLPGGAALAMAAPAMAARAAVPAVVPAVVPGAKVHQFSLRDRVTYTASEFLMWNPAARLVVLLVVGVIVIYVGSLAFARLDPDGKETNESPFWMAARSYLNPLEDDYATNKLRVLSVSMAMFGMIFFGIFIGMITEAVESGIAAADGGASRVVAANHTLICGWNSNTPKIITDINAVSGTRTKIVLLVAEAEKGAMMDELRDALSEEQQKRISISVRTGTPVLPHDLDKVAASRAGKIILSAARGVSAAESDRRILSRALALRSNVPLFAGDVVAELSSTRDEAILQSVLKDTRARSVQAVSAERLLFRFMAQAVRQVGLADCVAEMMGNNRDTVFHVLPLSKAAPNLVGMNFRDVRPTTIPGAIIAGYVDASTGKVVIATAGAKDSPALTAGTEMLLLGMPSSRQARIATAASSSTGSDEAASKPAAPRRASSGNRRSAEHILVCGWRPDSMTDFLTEMDAILPRGSTVTIVDEDAPDVSGKGAAADFKLKNIALSSVVRSPAQYGTLQGVLGPREKPFDHILVLSSALGRDGEEGKTYTGVEEDSKALTSLCYINQLLRGRKGGAASTTVTVEFVNEQVAEIARVNETATNIILPHSLSAHIAAQTVRESRLNSVWSELLSQRGKEVYLRPASSYVKSKSGLASFASISTDAALERDEVVVGYLPAEGGCVLNPAGPLRFDVRSWSPNDQVITLAED
jgi:ion channel POLLUX/CASTOR